MKEEIVKNTSGQEIVISFETMTDLLNAKKNGYYFAYLKDIYGNRHIVNVSHI